MEQELRDRLDPILMSPALTIGVRQVIRDLIASHEALEARLAAAEQKLAPTPPTWETK